MNSQNTNRLFQVTRTMWYEKRTAFRPVINDEEEDFFVVEFENSYYTVVDAFWGDVGNECYEKIHIAVSVAKMPHNIFHEAQCSMKDETFFFKRGRQKEMLVILL